MDRFTVRGLIYSGIAGVGLGYELFFVNPPRLFPVVMYSIVILIGLILIFFVHENKEQLPTL